MIEKIAPQQWEINQRTFPNLEKFYSQTDVSAYLSVQRLSFMNLSLKLIEIGSMKISV
jgi:hypothetical protein